VVPRGSGATVSAAIGNLTAAAGSVSDFGDEYIFESGDVS